MMSDVRISDQYCVIFRINKKFSCENRNELLKKMLRSKEEIEKTTTPEVADLENNEKGTGDPVNQEMDFDYGN